MNQLCGSFAGAAFYGGDYHTVMMYRLWAGGLVCACVCSSVLFLPKVHCQDVLSFSNAPVKMCRLWAGGLVCVCMCVCVLPY